MGAGLLLIALFLLCSAPVPARAAGTGVIEGTVVNGTAGGRVPAELKVTVHAVRDRTPIDKQEVMTDGAGRFRVEGLDTGANIVYLPLVDYAGCRTSRKRPVVLDGAGPAQWTIQVYETSPTPDALAFDRANMLILNVAPTALTVMEMGAVVNGGDRTFAANPQVTGSDRTLRFNLPAGATQVTPQAGLAPDALQSTPDGFATTDPVPGSARDRVQLPVAVRYVLARLDPDVRVAGRHVHPLSAGPEHRRDRAGTGVPGLGRTWRQDLPPVRRPDRRRRQRGPLSADEPASAAAGTTPRPRTGRRRAPGG